MSEERKGINLFEVNGIQYTDNIPENMFIGITKEQYCEYLQLQQENQQLKNNWNELKEWLKSLGLLTVVMKMLQMEIDGDENE